MLETPMSGSGRKAVLENRSKRCRSTSSIVDGKVGDIEKFVTNAPGETNNEAQTAKRRMRWDGLCTPATLRRVYDDPVRCSLTQSEVISHAGSRP